MASRSMKNRPSTKKKHSSAGALSLLAVMAAIVAAGCIGAYALGVTWLEDLPDYEDANAYNMAQPTVVYASDKTTVLAEFQLENRRPVALDQVGAYVIQGTIATEDERFYRHNGIDVMGIARALANNLLGGRLEGASTITQQFVRNTILASERDDISLRRKLREAYISVKLEERYGKDDILLMYLNTINYGSGAYGIQAAAQRYFSKDASDLTLAEAATLVGIPQAPAYNNPLDHPASSLKRRNLVLDRMLSNGYITQTQHEAAQAEPLALNPTVPSADGIQKYPYFTSYVRWLLTDPDGEYQYSKDEVFAGGLTVYTTLDVSLQEAAEAAAAAKEAEAGDPFEVSLVAVDPHTGYVKALVGGKDYSVSQVNLATGLGGSGRQPGSAFKTFTLVAALESGISPQTTIDCSARAEFAGWSVANINSRNYGTRSIASAFAVSSNTGFARLILSLGPSAVVEVAHRMGIVSELSPVASLTLGSSSVTPLEMAGAYATIANGGTRYDTEFILSVENHAGEVIVDNGAPAGTRALAPEVAHVATEVMEGVVASAEGTGQEAALGSGQVVAGKTGTSEGYRDSWFCGIVPQLSVAIWLGDRSDYASAQALPPSITAASVFSDFVGSVLAGQPLEAFPDAGLPSYGDNAGDDAYHGGTNSLSWPTGDGDEGGGKADVPSDAPGAEAGGSAGGTGGAGGSEGGGDAGGSGGAGGGGSGGAGEGGGSGGGSGGSGDGGGVGEGSGSGDVPGGGDAGGSGDAGGGREDAKGDGG